MIAKVRSTAPIVFPESLGLVIEYAPVLLDKITFHYALVKHVVGGEMSCDFAIMVSWSGGNQNLDVTGSIDDSTGWELILLSLPVISFTRAFHYWWIM